MSSSTSKMVDVDSIHWIERWFYWIFGISSIAYGLNCLRIESTRFQKSQQAVLSEGWSWLGRPRDLTDLEWSEWRVIVWIQVPICCVRVIINYYCRRWKFRPMVYKLLILAVDWASLSYLSSRNAVLSLVAQAALMFAVTYTNSVLAVWILGLTLVQSLNSDDAVTAKIKNLGMGEDMDTFKMFFTAEAFFHLKLISFGIEKVFYNICQSKYKKSMTSQQNFDGSENISGRSEQTNSVENKNGDKDVNGGGDETRDREVKESRTSNFHPKEMDMTEGQVLNSCPNFVDVLYYCLSLPMFYDGPVYNFNDFNNQVNAAYKSDSWNPDVKNILWRMARIAFWAVFIEVQCHFFYHQALHLAPSFLQTMSLPALLGMGYYQGQFFMVKYLCMYGLAMQWLRFEGVTAHAQPRCISWVYSYTDMWKSFDVGLYKFLKAYIFLPCISWLPGLKGKLVSCGLVFVFVYLFHGTQTAMLIWCAGNFVVLCIEVCASLWQLRSPQSSLSPAMQLRIRTLLLVPLYVASGILIFYFFFGEEVGPIFYNKMLAQASWTQLACQGLVYYANIHNALYIHQKMGCRVS